MFDSRVEDAVQIIWVNSDFKNGQKAFEELQQAAQEGDGDACYFLARCYGGNCFVNSAFHFEENDELVEQFMDKSIESGSAVGMFGARRLGGYKPRCGSFVQPPYHNDKEIWDEVANLAANGQLFCKLLIANAFYYGDIIDFLGINIQEMPDDQVRAMFHDFALKAMEAYEDIFSHGMMMAIGNYIDIVTSGDAGIPKDEGKKQWIIKLAADHGIPNYQVSYAESIEKTDLQTAISYYQKAMDVGYSEAFFSYGRLFTRNGKAEANYSLAAQCFEKCLELDPGSIGSHNRLGELYFYGLYGTINGQPDYVKAFELLNYAYEHENKWGSDMLGTCYLKGLGTQPDYVKAKMLFEIYPGEELCCIGLGEIYAYGLGVKENITKGWEYWNKFPENPRVVANRANFKWTLFGFKRK